jgi:hypothetical protein
VIKLRPKSKQSEEDELAIAHAVWLDVVTELFDKSADIRTYAEGDSATMCEGLELVPGES